ncbi:RNA polymerase sigma factor [Actinoallomurus purpureus]|uniref:RNA polymerase sigma factor n=1 Tax=Actinoallomurus purpureus TaxID=478114 RepID=UPI002091FDF5|nr:RNA polymerase sigma factor [Actinoallomurus purpureus]MCO6008254.1 RNA polymerase sigma factor [Actinoallomurus purpureus]
MISHVNEQVATDDEIVTWSLRDPEVFATLYDRHAPAIHRYIARRLGPDLADDLMAETFLLAFRQRARYDTARTDARPWLYGIATNLIGRHRRAEGRFWRAIARSGTDAATESLAERAADRVSAQMSLPALTAALARLSKSQRDVLLLTAEAGLSPVEIADALGVPKGTVHSRLGRARRKMREALGGIDPLDPREDAIDE